MRKQIALCIGNNDYQYSCLEKLKGAINDATAVAQKLKELNFDVELICDATRETLHNAIDKFESKLPDYDIALFYFAGHGFESDGKNLLMPIDTKEGDNGYKEWMALCLDRVISALDGYSINNHLLVKIIIIDACRQKPGARGIINTGFAPVFAPQGTIIAFSTSPGQYSIETEGHGEYTKAFLQYIDTPRIPIENMFKHVREMLAANTHGRQISWEHTSLMGNYYFNEDRIDAFSTYSADAIADVNYTFVSDSDIKIIVKDLKSHNWNIQNPAISAISSIDWNNVSANDVFVLGRNIYQSADGGAWRAQQFIREFSSIVYIPLEAKRHLLSGMAFEIYYNCNGYLRQRFKSSLYLDILNLLILEDFQVSKNFISSRLYEEDVLVYIPSKEERMEFVVECNETRQNAEDYKLFYLNSIYYHGQNILDVIDGNDSYDWITACPVSDFRMELAKQLLAPLDMVKIRYNISEDSYNRIAIPYSFVLKHK